MNTRADYQKQIDGCYADIRDLKAEVRDLKVTQSDPECWRSLEARIQDIYDHIEYLDYMANIDWPADLDFHKCCDEEMASYL